MHQFITKYNHLIIHRNMYNIQYKIPAINKQKNQRDELMGKI